MRAVSGHSALVETLSEIADGLGFSRLCALSGPTMTHELACAIADELDGVTGKPLIARDNSQAQVAALSADPALSGTDAVIAVGGGRTIDVAKSVCERIDRAVIVVPTQLTADGIASPVSVIRADSGAVESRRARLPVAVAVDLGVVVQAPVERTRAGLGDLLANASAVRDWRLAASAGDEVVDDFAALLAEAAADLARAGQLDGLSAGRVDTSFLLRLLHGLVLSGLAMEIAGSSRPCSGSEHLVSHAIDHLYPGTAAHGEQVAFGALLCTRFQGGDWGALRSLLVDAGMERAATGLGLSVEQIVAAIQAAPSTRPGRYTVLNEVDLTTSVLEPAVRDVITRPGP